MTEKYKDVEPVNVDGTETVRSEVPQESQPVPQPNADVKWTSTSPNPQQEDTQQIEPKPTGDESA